jgi:RNA recognition motif-containing protein
MTKLYVGNLPYSTSNQDLQDMFAKFGPVVSAMIITDRYSGRSKGFGFVEMENDEDAQKAIAEVNGQQMDGRTVVVSVARPREERPQGGGGFGGGRGDDRGGYGGGRGGDRGDRGDRGGRNRDNH